MTTHTDPLTFPTHLEVGFWRLHDAAGIDPGATLAQAVETMLVWADDDAEHEYGALACRQIRNALRDGRAVHFRLEPTPGRHGTCRDRKQTRRPRGATMTSDDRCPDPCRNENPPSTS